MSSSLDFQNSQEGVNRRPLFRNGAVGLFASTRTEAPITLVELQERLADMAKRSVTLNQLEDQVTVVNDDLNNLLDHAPRSQVDLILCNPPYFKATETSKKNLSEHYLLARHEITTNLEEICQVARHALKSNGRIAMVHRPDRFWISSTPCANII